jgi:hypothetical protein
MNELSHDEKQLIDQVRETLDKQADDLDYVTVQRLAAARRRAVSVPTRRPWLMPIGTFAAASVMALALGVWWTGPAREAAPLPVADMALLASADDVEFYDDLEFYVWLAGGKDAS